MNSPQTRVYLLPIKPPFFKVSLIHEVKKCSQELYKGYFRQRTKQNSKRCKCKRERYKNDDDIMWPWNSSSQYASESGCRVYLNWYFWWSKVLLTRVRCNKWVVDVECGSNVPFITFFFSLPHSDVYTFGLIKSCRFHLDAVQRHIAFGLVAC